MVGAPITDAPNHKRQAVGLGGVTTLVLGHLQTTRYTIGASQADFDTLISFADLIQNERAGCPSIVIPA